MKNGVLLQAALREIELVLPHFQPGRELCDTNERARDNPLYFVCECQKESFLQYETRELADYLRTLLII